MNAPANDIIARFADALVSAVLGELGENALQCVFIGGSYATDEMSFCLTADGVEVYSDVDVYAVVRGDFGLDEARNRAREAAANVPLEGPGYRFLRAPDVGVYNFESLAGQPPRPGTVGLDVKHKLVFGDPEVPVRAAARIGNKIPPEEALYLLENRLLELASFQREMPKTAGETDELQRLHAFFLCKTVMDVVTAALVGRGAYAPTRLERVHRLKKIASMPDLGWDDDRMALVDRCEGALSEMPSHDWARLVLEGVSADAAVALALAEWKRIASRVFGGPSKDWDHLVLERCHVGDYVNNFRQFRALNNRCRFKRRRSLKAGVHLSRYSVIDALRLSAMMDYLKRDAIYVSKCGEAIETLGPFLDRLTRSCGFVEGSLSERAFAMYRAAQ
jgi:hypothetical protein